MKTILRWALRLIPRPWMIKFSYTAAPILGWWYRGDRYFDPIDERGYRSFLSYGYGTMRDQVLAPGTLSLERHRLLWLFLQQKTNFFTQPKTLMHVAPEQAFYHRFKAMEHLSVTSVDLYSPLADVKADLCALPFADHSFDVILCNHVLEHIPDDQKALSEMYRVLKPGGWGVFQVPQDLSREVTFSDDTITDAKQRAAIFGQYDHVRIYGRDYPQRLAEAGFEVQMVNFTADLTPEAVDRYRLAAGELIPWVHKPLVEA